MATTDSFDNLVKDLTADITSRVHGQVQSVIADAVNKRVNEVLTRDLIEQVVVARVNQSMTDYRPNLNQFNEKVKQITQELNENLTEHARQQVDTVIKVKTAELNIANIARDQINVILKADRSTGKIFPQDSIPADAIKKQDLMLSGGQIRGGIIQEFSSTGIQDQATGCRLTIMDIGTVFENTLYAPKLEVKGDTVIEGDLDIRGKISETSPVYQNILRDTAARVKILMNDEIFAGYNDDIFQRISRDGINIDKLMVNNQIVFDGNKMSSAVLNSSLQTVGRLRDLQTQGETLLSETLYTTARRVGINTMEPSYALSIWDEEVELGVGKQKQNTARIAVQRANSLVLGANNKDNITLTPEGVTEIPQLKLGNMLMSSAASAPNYEAARGTIVFNENPSLGGPLGWVSLGSARWANFGIVD